MTNHETNPAATHQLSFRRAKNRWISPIAIILLGLALYLPGLRWGLPTAFSWSQDTIAGWRTVSPLQLHEAQGIWVGRYPPLHYVINNVLYAPVLSGWERTGELSTDSATGQITLQPPAAPKIGRLIFISRILTMVMACAAGLGIWAATRRLTGEDGAGVIAAGVLMIGADFTYFAHLGNVDVPSMCWFAWSVYFYVALLQGGQKRYGAALGLLAAMAVSTKDGVAGAYAGMAIALVIAETMRLRREGAELGSAIIKSLLQSRWAVGLGAFLLPYLGLHLFYMGFEGYLNHMKYWLGITPDTLHAQQYRYPDQFRLAAATVWYAAGAVGWPMVAVMAGATVYTIRMHRRIALWLLLPALTYYVVVIAQIKFVYARFLFPPLALMGMLVGLAALDFLRSRRIPLTLRWCALAGVGLLSVGYAAAVDLEMLSDSRYEAEAWFDQNVPRSTELGVFHAARPSGSAPAPAAAYLPRLNDEGYPIVHLPMDEEAIRQYGPEYLILTSYNFQDYEGSPMQTRDELLSGGLGYRVEVSFGHRFTGTGSSWLSIAGWGTERIGKISPTIHVMKRDKPDP